MRNIEAWRPTKFSATASGLASAMASVRSRLVETCMAPHYERAIVAHATGDLLDLGCGACPLYGTYRSRVSSVTCVDWPSSEHSALHVDVLADFSQPLPLKAERFDTVISTDVLEHLPDPDVFFGQVSRVLRRSGVLILGVPFLLWLHERPHDHLRHTEYSLARHCAMAGLDVITLEPYGGPLAVVLDIVGKNVKNHRLAYYYQAAALRLWKSTLGRRCDAVNQRLFPLGYCLVASKHAGKVDIPPGRVV